MNTIRSVGYGWGVLIVAGGGAYYFAKKSINADRAAKAEAESRRRALQRSYETDYHPVSSNPNNLNAAVPPQNLPPKNLGGQNAAPRSIVDAVRDKDWHQASDDAGNPSQEASHDPAPTRHAPEDEEQRVHEKSKYEATDVYRSRKGDRFS